MSIELCNLPEGGQAWEMRVLIVGCGYVGLAVGSDLARRGHQVFGLRRTSSAELELREAGITPLSSDITRLPDLRKLPDNFDWVVNTVSSSGGGAEEYRQVYLQGARNLLAWLAAMPPRKLVYTSSTSVYGQRDGSWVDENSPTKPGSETSRVLLETERVLLEAQNPSASFPSVILRVAGIYGPQRGYWLQAYLQGEARLSGQGERFLNMIHRDDVAAMIIAALQQGKPGEIYNAVDNEPVAQRDLFGWFSAATGLGMPPAAESSGEATSKRGFTDKRVSNEKLKRELAYTFKYPTFREGFAAEIERFKRG